MRTPDQIPGLEPVASRNHDQPIDVRRVGGRSRQRPLVIDLVDENRHLAADESFEALRADVFLKLHQLYAPRFANIVGNGPGSSFAAAPSTGVSKCAHPVQLRLFEKLQQHLEIFIRLAGKAGDEGRADREIPDISRASVDPLEIVLRAGGALHREIADWHAGTGRRVGQDLAFNPAE